MKKSIYVFVFAGLLIFSSCIQSTESIRYTPTQISYTITPNNSPSLATETTVTMPTPNPTKDNAIPTATISPTFTTTSNSDVIQNCYTIHPDLYPENRYDGKIVFETHNPSVINNISIYDFSTGEILEIQGKGTDLSVSVDHSMFAFEDFDAKRLEIFSSDETINKTLPYGKYWGSISQWLGNQNIMILLAEPDPVDPAFLKYPPDKVLVNPFTNEEQTLFSDYPDIDDVSPFCPWGRLGCTVYDPTLSRVVYPGSTSIEGGRYSGYILYGIPEEKKLTEVVNQSWYNHPPVWSPDGSQFIMMGDADFYLVSYDGDISKITNMNPLFDITTATCLKYLAEYYSWSPDGKHIALWLEELSSMHRTLAILDLNTGTITDTCIRAGYDPNDIRTEPYPAWSPDGKSLVVAANYRPEEYGNDVILVDLEKGKGYTITTDLFPVGWLISQ